MHSKSHRLVSADKKSIGHLLRPVRTYEFSSLHQYKQTQIKSSGQCADSTLANITTSLPGGPSRMDEVRCGSSVTALLWSAGETQSSSRWIDSHPDELLHTSFVIQSSYWQNALFIKQLQELLLFASSSRQILLVLLDLKKISMNCVSLVAG